MSGPVVLVVLDGWGLAPPGPDNAVELAETPAFDDLWRRHPHTTLAASGRAVGLPEGQMGNSEVGHLNLGAGRVVPQDLVRIDDAVADGSLCSRPAVDEACAAALHGRGVLHLVGLVSDVGVHSHVDHLRALVGCAAAGGVPHVLVHAITDGRDVSPHQAADLLERLQREWAGGPAAFATVSGRFWAMDRDHRTERTERARAAIVEGRGARAADAAEAVRASYAADVSDEFVEPVVLGGADRRFASGDPVLCFNFRPDRMRQIAHALEPSAGLLVLMTRYDESLAGPVVFDEQTVDDTLADVLERAGVSQLHVAETEKYAHVTYFFNGGVEQEHHGERRVLLPSPRDVATYDLAPEMSADAVAEAVERALDEGSARFVVVNFANADMVGHTGVIPAVVRAVEATDRGLARCLAAVRRAGGVALVTADHGNAEHLLERDGSPHTAHTTNPVPFAVTRDGLRLREGGCLADVAPTVLALLDVAQPADMDGRSLIVA
jgi:2,3-bisphosphoglycerate-independent phosphoglycerate mutase